MRKTSAILEGLSEAKTGNYSTAYAIGDVVRIDKDLWYKRVAVNTFWKIVSYDPGLTDYEMVKINPNTDKVYKGDPWTQGEGYLTKWEKEGKISILSRMSRALKGIKY